MTTQRDVKAINPRAIRDRIRADHHRIAEQIALVEELAETTIKDDAAALAQLRERLQQLGTMLLDHLRYEEYELPALADTDADAEAWFAEMQQDHRTQREIFDRVIRELDETAVGESLVVGVRELVRAVRDDMAHEERELLSKI